MNVTRDDFVSEAAFEEYERTIQLFYAQLTYLNTTIYIMERIAEFPWSLFGELNRMTTFFHLVMVNSFISAILTVTRLVADNGDRPTMTRFQSKLRELIRPEVRSSLNLDQHLRRMKTLRKQMDPPLQRVRDVRNQYIAHLGRELLLPTDRQNEMRISLSDLVELKNLLNKAFEILALRDETYFQMLPLEYSSNSVTDIEKILDDIARNSSLLNAPERFDLWEQLRERYTDEQIAQLNHYRQKFGLPPV